MRIIFIAFCSLIGAAFGSFACCQAWRIRLKETGKKDPGKRSVCLACGKKLKWFENMPILSWVLQKGKCRKCGAKIGKAEICAEVLGAASFGLFAWKFSTGAVETVVLEFIGSLDLAGLVAVLAAMVGMLILAVYDGKWGKMPVGILIYAIVMGLVFAILENELLPTIFSVALLAGTYYLLYFFSKEKLVGGGDWMLCLAIGLILGKWQLALIELFLANFLGSVVMLGFKKKKAAFGPFLVVAFVIIFAFSDALLSTLAMNL
ncbi:prepilin peptidase [Candidatus Saccharibacteria bacterium]|nr:prepilin peptidase [Candidatus Saccharibacteria bacterium]